MNKEEINLKNLLESSTSLKVDDMAPNFRKKNVITNEQLEKIIKTLSLNLTISDQQALIGMMLLFLNGAASQGAPASMSIDLGEGKVMEKRNIVNACSVATGHQFIRRIAETLAKIIGEFAYNNRLKGELAYRINNRLKAESGECLNEKEMAFCSSFSQVIPDLAEITSERLTRLLAEDYHKRFDTQKIKKETKNEYQNQTQDNSSQDRKRKAR